MISVTSCAMGLYILGPTLRNIEKMECIHTLLYHISCLKKMLTISLLGTQQSCKKCSNFHRVEC